MPTSHRGADAPLAISVIDLVHRPGAMRSVTRTVSAPGRLGTDVVSVPDGAEVELQVSLESVSEGIWVSGTATSQAHGECGRCLDPVTLDVNAPLQALYVNPADARDLGEGSDEDQGADVLEFDGETIDLEQLVRDAVVEQLPFTPLCDPDCPGLCDQCGVRFADDPDHVHDVIDPRWASLQSLSEKKES